MKNSNEKNVDFVENNVVVENDVVVQLNDQFRRDRERTSRDNISLRFNQSFFDIVDFNDDDHLFDSISFDVQIETQIIFDDQIIDRRFSIFKKQKRNYVEIKDFLSKHEKFHVLNSHTINKNNLLIVIKQYFENKTIEWFIFFFDSFTVVWRQVIRIQKNLSHSLRRTQLTIKVFQNLQRNHSNRCVQQDCRLQQQIYVDVRERSRARYRVRDQKTIQRWFQVWHSKLHFQSKSNVFDHEFAQHDDECLETRKYQRWAICFSCFASINDESIDTNFCRSKQ